MSSANRMVAVWLLVVAAIVFAMIIVGGVTRLTHSGLSMVDWKPILGFIPPTSEVEWNEAFDAYKQYPEYQKVNKGMSLDAFKDIFYWEYGHRLLGRSIGLVFFIPFMVFLILGMLEKPLILKLTIALVLGGLQGLMGWYMVKSGLVDIPRVSHFRLAAHLVLALIIISYIYWIILGLWQAPRFHVSRGLRLLSMLVLGLAGVQIIYGAFTAGLRAGLGFNTFPLMDGVLVPDAAIMMSPFWLNLFENGAMIQFIHRWLGTSLLLAVAVMLGLCIASKAPRAVLTICGVVVAITFAQFILGILTLINYVPLVLASVHQGVACFVLLAMVLLVYSVSPSEQHSVHNKMD